jgi:hypothetical protein
MSMDEQALRRCIANAERGLLVARSPRQRLAHLFKLAVARDALAHIEKRPPSGEA